MIRVVADTNVYVSAIVFGGTCEAILALAEVDALVSLARPSIKLSEILTHDPDYRILECALAVHADFLVTGDKKHLQPLKTFRGVRIVSPREFLDLFRCRPIPRPAGTRYTGSRS